ELIVQLLAKDPAERPASAQAVTEKVDAIAEEQARAVPAKPRRWWPAIIGAAACLAVLIGLWANGGIRVRTPDGVLVVNVNEPGAEVFVNGQEVEVSWEDGRKKATIRVKAGTKDVEVRVGKIGFTGTGGKVTFDDAGRAVFHAELVAAKSAD